MIDPRRALSDVARALGSIDSFPSLEELITSSDYFGLTTATAVQRAIYRIAEGRPLDELATNPLVIAALGGEAAVHALENGGPLPKEFYIIAAIRTAKSIFAGAVAIRATQTIDVSSLGAGEIPRVSILSTSRDNADIVFNHIVGNMLAKPKLRALVIGEPNKHSIMVRHPSGRSIEIKVIAGGRAGMTLVGRWCATVIFDEAPRMVGADDGVVNFEHSYHSVIGRLLPGAQLIAIGSPWAPFGPIYDRVQKHFGKPKRDLVLVKATGPMMNPILWTPEECERIRTEKPLVYKTDVLGEFVDPEATLFSSEEIEDATREGPIETRPERDGCFVAMMDPATRRNAWSLVVVQALPLEGRLRVALARQWVPFDGKLDPKLVLGEIAKILRGYGLDVVGTDQWSSDLIQTVAADIGLRVIEIRMTPIEKVDAYDSLKGRVANRTMELPPLPALAADLLAVRKRAKQSGFEIVLPLTGDGRHADFAPALVVAAREAARFLEDGGASYEHMGIPARSGGRSMARDVLNDASFLQVSAEEYYSREDPDGEVFC